MGQRYEGRLEDMAETPPTHEQFEEEVDNILRENSDKIRIASAGVVLPDPELLTFF